MQVMYEVMVDWDDRETLVELIKEAEEQGLFRHNDRVHMSEAGSEAQKIALKGMQYAQEYGMGAPKFRDIFGEIKS